MDKNFTETMNERLVRGMKSCLKVIHHLETRFHYELTDSEEHGALSSMDFLQDSIYEIEKMNKSKSKQGNTNNETGER